MLRFVSVRALGSWAARVDRIPWANVTIVAFYSCAYVLGRKGSATCTRLGSWMAGLIASTLDAHRGEAHLRGGSIDGAQSVVLMHVARHRFLNWIFGRDLSRF